MRTRRGELGSRRRVWGASFLFSNPAVVPSRAQALMIRGPRSRSVSALSFGFAAEITACSEAASDCGVDVIEA